MAAFGKINKGDGGGKADHYVKTGMTAVMHGKATGGHPTIRASEFKDKGGGHPTSMSSKRSSGHCNQ